MIHGFDTQTESLTDYEKETLIPVIIRGLEVKVGKSKAVTNKYIVKMLKGTYKVSEARIRKVINYIRTHDLIPCLIADSDGYYIAESNQEVKDYEQSLLGRESAIHEVRTAITRQRVLRYGNE